MVERLRTALARDIIGTVIAHWDERRQGPAEVGHLGAVWSNLGVAAGTKTVGVNRIQIDPGKWSTPYHRHTGEEEIFYVLSGIGRVPPGRRCLRGAARRLHRASVCARRTRSARATTASTCSSSARAREPRSAISLASGVAWIGGTWADVGGGDHPWKREVAAGEPDVPELGERPANVVNRDDVEGSYERQVAPARARRRRGADAASTGASSTSATRARRRTVHSADEEIFVVLEGEGILELWPTPQRAREGVEYEEHPIRAGHVISRPAGSGIAHGLRASEPGMTYLAYGTRRPEDTCYYPRSNKIYFPRGRPRSPGSRIWTTTTGSRNS